MSGKSFFLTMLTWQHSVKGGSVHSRDTACCCPLEINSEEPAFPLLYVTTMLTAWKRETEWPTRFLSALFLQLAKPYVENRLFYQHSDPVSGFPGVAFSSKSTINRLVNKYRRGCLLKMWERTRRVLRKKHMILEHFKNNSTKIFVARVPFCNWFYEALCSVRSIRC